MIFICILTRFYGVDDEIIQRGMTMAMHTFEKKESEKEKKKKKRVSSQYSWAQTERRVQSENEFSIKGIESAPHTQTIVYY